MSMNKAKEKAKKADEEGRARLYGDWSFIIEMNLRKSFLFLFAFLALGLSERY
jgi:hypothetical protein